MSNTLLYIPCNGTRYYYNSTVLGGITESLLGSGSLNCNNDGSKTYYQFSDDYALNYIFNNTINSNLTIEYWINLSSWTNTGTSIGYSNSRWQNFAALIPEPQLGSNTVTFKPYYGRTTYPTADVTLSSQSDWVHVAFTWDISSQEGKWYINGNLLLTSSGLGMMYYSRLILGGMATDDTTLDNKFTGKISNIIMTEGIKYTSTFTPGYFSPDKTDLTSVGTTSYDEPPLEPAPVVDGDILFYFPGNGTQAFTHGALGDITIRNPGSRYVTNQEDDIIYSELIDGAIKYDFTNDLPLDLTIEFWFKSESTSSGSRCIIMPWGGVDSNKLQLQYSESSGNISNLYFENRNGNLRVTIPSNISSSEWHHLAYVQDKTNSTSYAFLDGTKLTTSSGGSITGTKAWNSIVIGGKGISSTATSEYYQGDIDELIVTAGVKYQSTDTFTPTRTAPSKTGLTEVGEKDIEEVIPDPEVPNDGLAHLNIKGTTYDILPKSIYNRKDGSRVKVWQGTLAEWQEGRDNGTIPDSWTCIVDDDYTGSSAVPNKSVNDFNSFESNSMYNIVHTTAGVTQNAPLDVTSDWLITYVHNGNIKVQMARKLDDPATELNRSCINGTWTDWVYTYAHYEG
jgi:hypothetical protein